MATTTTDDQKIESKVIEEVKAEGVDTVVSADTAGAVELEQTEVDDAHVLPVEVKDVVEKDSSSIALPSVQVQVAEPAVDSSTKTEEEQHHQPLAADDDAPQPSEKAMEQPDVLPTKAEESIEIKDLDNSTASKEVDEPVSVVPEFEVKTPEVTEKQDEETEVLPIPSEDLGVLAKEVEIPEPVLPTKEQSEGTEEVEKQSAEETSESSLVHLIKESEADVTKPVVPEVDVKPEEPSELTKEIEEPEAAASEGQMKIEEEQVEAEKEGEKTEPEAAAAEVPVKPEEQAQGTEQVDDKKDATPDVDAESPEVQVELEGKPEAPTPIEVETRELKAVTPIVAEPTDAKPESFEPEVELKPEEHTEVVEQSIESENVKDEKITEILSSETETSIPDAAEDTSIEDKKKEIGLSDTVEVSSKELVVEAGKAEVEKEGSTITNKERDVPKEELAHPKIVEDVTNAVSNAEVTEAVAENLKGETAASVEPEKNGEIEGKLDEDATTAANDLVKESRDSRPEAKEAEGEKSNEDKQVKEEVEDGDDTKITEVASKQFGAKKQSGNILSKVKQSLVKAKKAIVGKSPGSKTPSSDTIK